MSDDQELQNVNPDGVQNAPDKFDTLSQQLTETLNAINERVGGLEEKIDSSIPKEELPQQEEEPWKPKTWGDFITKAEEVANQTLERRITESQKQDELAKAEEQAVLSEIDKEFDVALGELEKSNFIPRIVDANNPDDEGRKARKELFGLGVYYNSPDLHKMADMRSKLHEAGYVFDVDTNSVIKKRPTPGGRMAPISSPSGGVSKGNTPAYKDIHNLSMDEIIRRYNNE